MLHYELLRFTDDIYIFENKIYFKYNGNLILNKHTLFRKLSEKEIKGTKLFFLRMGIRYDSIHLVNTFVRDPLVRCRRTFLVVLDHVRHVFFLNHQISSLCCFLLC